MRSLFLAPFLAAVLAMGIPYLAIAGPPSGKSMPSQAADGLNKAMQNSGGVVGLDDNELTIAPSAEAGIPGDAGHPGSPFTGLSMPDSAAHGLNPAMDVNNVISFTDNALTVSPSGDFGGPGDAGNPGFGTDNHPISDNHPGGP